MADGVGKRQGVVLLAVELNGKLVVLESRTNVLPVALNLAESGMRLRRLELVSRGPAQIERLAEAAAGVVQPMVPARLVTVRDPLSRGCRTHWASVACGRIDGKVAQLSGYGPPVCRKKTGIGRSGFPRGLVSHTMERMAYFLFKTEPDVYSFDHFLRDQETKWDGVTNPTAVMHLRQMKAGTKWIFYHTGDERTAVGTGTVVSVDPTDPKVPIVKVKVGKRLKHPKSLMAIKSEPLFEGSPLVIIGRLSVVPLTREQWDWLVA